MAVAHDVDAGGLLRQIGVGRGQLGQQRVAPMRPGAGQQVLPRRRRGAERAVVAEHGLARHGPQALVQGVHVAQAGAPVEHVVPARRCAGPVFQRGLQAQVGHQPGGVRCLQGLLAPAAVGAGQHPRRDEERQRHHAAARLPALQPIGGHVPGVQLDAALRGGDAAHHAAGQQPLAQRCGQLAAEPAVALGPGQQAGFLVARLRRLARRVEAVPAGEVVDAGPGRDGVDAGPEIVAAAVVQVPAQLRVGEALLAQPCTEKHGVLRQLHLGQRLIGHGNRVTRFTARLGHQRGEAAVLRQRGRAHAFHRQQAVLPVAVEEQALLRAVAQVQLVVLPAAGQAAAQAEFLQQVLHMAGVVARHRQVVRAHGAGDAVHRHAAAVAAGRVFQLQQREIVLPGQPQRPRRRQPGDAAASDHRMRAAGDVGRALLPRLAQQVAALLRDAGEAALDGLQRLPRAPRQAQQTAGAGHEQRSPAHRQCQAARKPGVSGSRACQQTPCPGLHRALALSPLPKSRRLWRRAPRRRRRLRGVFT